MFSFFSFLQFSSWFIYCLHCWIADVINLNKRKIYGINKVGHQNFLYRSQNVVEVEDTDHFVKGLWSSKSVSKMMQVIFNSMLQRFQIVIWFQKTHPDKHMIHHRLYYCIHPVNILLHASNQPLCNNIEGCMWIYVFAY